MKPARVMTVLVGIAILVVAGFMVVWSGVFEPETVQEATPGPGSSPSASVSEAPPSPTASPSPTTPGQVKAKNVEGAMARLVEYYSAMAAVANDGYENWDTELRPFWGHPVLHASLRAVYTELAGTGEYTTGAASIEKMRVTEYKTSEVGNEEVHLNACVDFGDVRTFSEDDKRIPRVAGAPARYQFDYVMRHQGPDSYWTVNAQSPHQDRPC